MNVDLIFELNFELNTEMNVELNFESNQIKSKWIELKTEQENINLKMK